MAATLITPRSYDNPPASCNGRSPFRPRLGRISGRSRFRAQTAKQEITSWSFVELPRQVIARKSVGHHSNCRFRSEGREVKIQK